MTTVLVLIGVILLGLGIRTGRLSALWGATIGTLKLPKAS